MCSLGNSIGEGNDPGMGDKFVNTGYGTYAGAGNVETNAADEAGTGYDEKTHQVKTKFASYDIGYDPVTQTATENVTSGYVFPGMDLLSVAGGTHSGNDAGGMTDVSISAAGHASLEQSKKEEAQKK